MDDSNQTERTEKYLPVDNQRGGKRKVWLITCGSLLLIFACICSLFLVFSSSALNSATGFNPDPGAEILETKIMELGEGNSFSPDKIAVIEIADVINFATQSDTSSGTNNKTVNAQLQKAKNDESVKAVILRFNTPGGAVNAAEPICSMIKEVNKEKPVYAFIDAQGASLGYLLPNCTKFIYASPMTVTGSIGVRADLVDYNGILTNLGARSTTITNSAGDSKTQEGLFDKNSEEYKRYQSILDEIYLYFVNTVWEGRKDKGTTLTYEKLLTYADGQIFSGKQAKEAGLVDELGEYKDVINKVYEKMDTDEKVEVVEYTIEVSPFAGIFGAIDKYSNMLKDPNVNRSEMKLMMIK